MNMTKAKPNRNKATPIENRVVALDTLTPHASKARTRASDWTPKFLAELARRGIVKDACRAAGIDRKTAYRRKTDDSAFAEAWKDALDESADVMEREAFRRAVEGVDRPVFQGGEKIGVVREYSDSLLTLMLKANRPNKYRERAESLNLNLDVSALTDEQLERIARGEDARLVIASAGAGGTGTTQTPADAAPAEQVAGDPAAPRET